MRERLLGSSVPSRLDLARATREGLPAETARRLAVFADIFVDFYMDEASFWYPVRSPNDSLDTDALGQDARVGVTGAHVAPLPARPDGRVPTENGWAIAYR